MKSVFLFHRVKLLLQVGQTYFDPDSVTIYDGSNDEATQIAKLKGSFENDDGFFYSTKNTLFVKFESDYHYHYNYGGFHATIHYGNPNLNQGVPWQPYFPGLIQVIQYYNLD